MEKDMIASERALLVRNFLRVLESEFELMVMEFGEIISSFNIAHWKILMGVWERSGEITQTEAKKLIQTIPRYQSDKARRDLIKELSSSGMILKSLHPVDERKVILSITEPALPKIERYLERVEHSIREYSKKLTS